MGYPITLQLPGKPVLVVGGGAVAHRRVCRLLADSAQVTVVAPRLCDELRGLVDAGAMTWVAREFLAGDLAAEPAPWLVHTATGDLAVDESVAREADRLRVWCVRADDGARSAAWSPAVADGAPGTPAEGLQIAVTGDRDPRRARAVRDAILAGLASGTLPVRRVRPVGRPSAGSAVESAGSAGSAEPQAGTVHLVGGGPGDPGLLTVRGRALLAAADVVVTDRLGPTDVLAELGPDIEIVDVGKRPGHHPVPQERINELLVEHARAGRTVVRLKGGDPFVLGRGGEEALHCRARGIPVEVVPGVTSAVSVPAAAGIPVTHRGVATGVVVASAHEGADVVQVCRDAPSDATLVLLMGVSTIAVSAESLLAAGRAPDTPVAFIERGWTAQQRTTVTTLEKAAWTAEHEGVRSPAVVVIGDVVRLREHLGDLRPLGA
ncbi:MAG TPA: uroporphyrinogen-III C-methyltransferase [Dermatophilaceae bacterium]|nr:uroporphyrinogen-III C-methyltransferase [Dermatophilaceae bacterium]